MEVIFVDDASDPPASDVLRGLNIPQLRIIRNDNREGLIRAKTIGARATKGDLLVFLDAHIRAYPGWLEPMISLTNDDYRRVVVPTIPVLDGNTWEQIKEYVGVKLIFDWKMDFIWYVDSEDDFVPIMSGGLLAITKRWFEESGEYDEGMLQWGGENVEQSVKTWLCGGEIVVARSSRIGHVFRDVSPYDLNITQIHVNKARAVDVWFDEWANYYYRANPFDKERRSSPESLASRFAIKERLGCKPFSTFVEKFRNVFVKYNLLPTEVTMLRHMGTGLCLELEADGTVRGNDCDLDARAQMWVVDSWERLRNGQFVDDCLETHGEPVQVGLCSAHVPAQQKWRLHNDGQVVKSPGQGEEATERCMSMSDDGGVSMHVCPAPLGKFEKYNTQPYSHEQFK
jgi:glycosyltransferase involved in cell wall biosynthesis